MFQSVSAAPPDAILGLTEACRLDPNPQKVNLSVGQYKNAAGETPALNCVKQAEQRLLQEETSKGYLPIEGLAQYNQNVQALLLGNDRQGLEPGRLATIQTPGGTGALRVTGDFIRQALPGKRIWLSEPTWPNHPSIFAAAEIEMEAYPYLDAESGSVDFDSMTRALEAIPAGEIVLFHACCHNPTGADLATDQWRCLADLLKDKDLLPVVDFAYHGFGSGLDDDAVGARVLCRELDEVLICSSFSKNFGLYRERTGALTVLGKSPAETAAVLSRIKRAVRSNYSNPPSHGGAVVAMILEDVQLRGMWEKELAEMRDRIRKLRTLLAETMNRLQNKHDFGFINQQRGMFSFSGLAPDQVDRLREEHSIYIVRNGRINVAGLKEANVEPVCQAIASVL